MPRLVRDRVTWLTYAQLGVWGFFLYGFGPVVPLLRDEQGTSAAVASLHGTSITAGALLGGVLFPPVVRRLGRGPIIWVGLAGAAAGTAALASLRPLPATLTAVLVTATFGTLLVNGVNVLIAGHHGPAAPAALSEANAACAGVGVLAPAVIGLAVSAGIGWRPALAVEIGLIALVALAALIFRVRPPRQPSGAVAAAVRSGRLPRAYWLTWVLIAATGSIEVCLSLWAADVLRTHAGLSAGAASGAVAAIVGGMFLGRLAGGRLALRYAPVPLLLGALTVSLFGFTVFWASPVGWLAVAGLLVLGLGNATHYPLAMSIAFTAAGPAADRAAGYSSYAAGIGFGVAPLVLGRVADGIGPHLAFLLLPGFIGMAALLALAARKALARLPAQGTLVAIGEPGPLAGASVSGPGRGASGAPVSAQ